MIGQPTPPPLSPPILPARPAHEALPSQSLDVERKHSDDHRMGHSRARRPKSSVEGTMHPAGVRGAKTIGMTLCNGSLRSLSSENEQERLHVRDVSGPGRSHLNSTAIEQGGQNDRGVHQSAIPAENERVRPPSYNEATERISIFIDGDALQAIQESSPTFSVGFLEKIRATHMDQCHVHGALPNTYHPISQAFAPPAQSACRPLPPLPLTARANARNSRHLENAEPGHTHHRHSITLPIHPSRLDRVAVRTATPDHIPARSKSWIATETNKSCSAPEAPRPKCECTLEQHHPQSHLSILEPHSGHSGDRGLLQHGYWPQPAPAASTEATEARRPDIVDLHLRLDPPQRPRHVRIATPAYKRMYSRSDATQVPPHRRIEAIAPSLPPQFNNAAEEEESLHVDELSMPVQKPLAKMEKALLRRVEFGPKVEYSVLRLS